MYGRTCLSAQFQYSQALLEQPNHFPQSLDIPRQGPHRLNHIERRPQNHQNPPQPSAWLTPLGKLARNETSQPQE